MQLLITGGAGFIGSHTAEYAHSVGHTVRVIDNLITGQRTNLPTGVEFIHGDVTDPSHMRRAVAGCDAVIHLAALVSVPHSLTEPMETHFVNTTGTVVALEAARQAGVHRFVLASTCAVFGDLPGRKNEASPTMPLVPYAASKLMAEQWAQLYHRAYGMETVVLRYFNVYGPRQLASSPYSGVLARWSAAIADQTPCIVYGDGTQTRDFVSVHDVAAANLLMATTSAADWGDVYIVSTASAVTLNTVLAELAGVIGEKPLCRFEPRRAGDVLHSEGDSMRLQSLGWRPNITLREGLAETVRAATVA